VQLDAEDSLALETRPSMPAPAGARLAIGRFPHLSNATDFRLLKWADWITSPPGGEYEFVILPGSKNTIADLAWLKQSGLMDWVLARHRRGATVIGVCGGYQMLGRTIVDPGGIESPDREAAGLGLLPGVTTLSREKRTRTVVATSRRGLTFGGYEIHLGVTALDETSGTAPFAVLDDGSSDGACATGIIGTYLHGAFENPGVCAEVFGIDAPVAMSKAREYQRLAAWFEQHARHLDHLGLG
jgi:adenosylcobyric acid synthase